MKRALVFQQLQPRTVQNSHRRCVTSIISHFIPGSQTNSLEMTAHRCKPWSIAFLIRVPSKNQVACVFLAISVYRTVTEIAHNT